MSGPSDKIGAKRERAIIALMSSRTVEEAARVAGISVRALYRWMAEPAFDAAYRKAGRAAFRQQVSRLRQASSAAVTALLKLVADPGSPPAVKARAAYYVLTMATKAIEIDDIEHRVSELERTAEERE